MLAAIAFLSLPISTTFMIISSKLISPLPSLSRAENAASASSLLAGPRTSSISSRNSASFPSTTKDIHSRLANASEDLVFSKASTTTECAELGLKTCLPVISEAMFPNTEVTLSPIRPISPINLNGVADPLLLCPTCPVVFASMASMLSLIT